MMDSHGPRDGHRWTFPTAIAGALAVAVAGGIWAGQAGAPQERAQADVGQVVHAGPATLTVPSDWRRVGSRSTAATAVLAPWPGSRERVLVTLGAAPDRSLVPKALRDRLDGLGTDPRETRLGGYLAWRYSGAQRDGTPMDVTVVPTSAGSLGVACAGSGCAETIQSVTVRRAEIYAPSPDLALRLRLPRVLSALDDTRVRGRVALRRAATPARQAREASALERAHLEAADALRPFAGGAGAALPGELSDTASAYASLARAAAAGSASGFSTAAGDVRRAEARLDAATRRFLRTEPRVAAVARPTSTELPVQADGGVGPGTVAFLLLGLLALGAAGAGALAPRRGGRFPKAAQAAAAPRPRTVIARPWPPADPSTRWDAPPPAVAPEAPAEPEETLPEELTLPGHDEAEPAWPEDELPPPPPDSGPQREVAADRVPS